MFDRDFLAYENHKVKSGVCVTANQSEIWKDQASKARSMQGSMFSVGRSIQAVQRAGSRGQWCRGGQHRRAADSKARLACI